MKVIHNAIEQLKYTDTHHIEWISILVSLFYIPELLNECNIHEYIGRYWFMCSAIIGIIGLIKNSIMWRYLHVQTMLISYLIPVSTIVLRNVYHPLHLKFFGFQIALSIFLIWRLGTEKLYRNMHKEIRNG